MFPPLLPPTTRKPSDRISRSIREIISKKGFFEPSLTYRELIRTKKTIQCRLRKPLLLLRSIAGTHLALSTNFQFAKSVRALDLRHGGRRRALREEEEEEKRRKPLGGAQAFRV